MLNRARYVSAKSKTKACHCCNGSGREINHRIVGEEMRKLRLSRNYSQRAVAASMGFTVPYISDLERGDRNWRPELIEAYRKACEV